MEFFLHILLLIKLLKKLFFIQFNYLSSKKFNLVLFTH